MTRWIREKKTWSGLQVRKNVNHAIDNKLYDHLSACKKGNAASVITNRVSIKVIRGSEELYFESITAASRELAIPYSTLNAAITNNRSIKGLVIIR